MKKVWKPAVLAIAVMVAAGIPAAASVEGTAASPAGTPFQEMEIVTYGELREYQEWDRARLGDDAQPGDFTADYLPNATEIPLYLLLL